jgi:hypothetical protein
MPRLEAVIQKEILQYLRNLPLCVPFKIIAANERGVPDIICCLNSRFVGFEVKRPGAKPTRIQDAQRERIAAAGGVVYVVTSMADTRNIIANIYPGIEKL